MTYALTPFIMLDGNAGEAVEFYEQALGAVVVFKQTFGEAPADPQHPVPEGIKSRLAHSVLKVGGADLFVADFSPGQANRSGNQVNICITAPTREEAERLYGNLLEGGQVLIPLQPVHFSPAYGMVTDKFGVTFQIFAKREAAV